MAGRHSSEATVTVDLSRSDGNGTGSCSMSAVRGTFAQSSGAEMDFTHFQRDIDDLVMDYAKKKLTILAEMKIIWKEKKFSYIYEARPKVNPGFFMQSMFNHCIGHMTSSGSISQRVGGLYCLYCLYMIQPYKPAFQIYLSIGDLARLKSLVDDTIAIGLTLVPSLVKKMFKESVFLFGFVDPQNNSVQQRAGDIAETENKSVKVAYDKLLGKTKIGNNLHMDLAAELEVESHKKLTSDYEKSKELAVREASQVVDTEDIKHIAQNETLVDATLQEMADGWDAQKETFYTKTGISRQNAIVPVDEGQSRELVAVDDDQSTETLADDDFEDEINKALPLSDE